MWFLLSYPCIKRYSEHISFVGIDRIVFLVKSIAIKRVLLLLPKGPNMLPTIPIYRRLVSPFAVGHPLILIR